MDGFLLVLLVAAVQSEEVSTAELPRSLSGEVLRTAWQAAPAAKEEGLVLNVGAHVRFSIPFGAADRSTVVYGAAVVVVDNGISWTDFFHPGWGFDLEIDLFFGGKGPGPNREPGFNYGALLLLQTDEYAGDTVDGNAGTSISVENLTMNSLLVGGKVIQTLGGGFYADGHVGLGVVHYLSVEGTFTGPGLLKFRDTVFEDTWTFASEVRGHAGVRLGPLGLALGLGFRIQAPPTEGHNFSMNSGAFWTFDIDLGVELGF